MKKLPLLIILMAISCSGQYLDLSVDGNKLFGIIDNPRTETQNRGIDFDLELGATTEKVGVYLFYGRFDAIDYQNYGLGTDFYLAKGEWYDIAFGGAISVVLRKQMFGVNYDRPGWGSYMGWNARLQGVYWVFRSLGASWQIKYQTRGDLPGQLGILEGNIGIRYKF